MKKLVLATAVALAVGASTAQAETRSLAMGGAGVSNGNYIQAGFLNPALMARFEERDHVGLVFPSISIEAADEAELIDKIDAFQEAFDRLDMLLDSGASEAEITAARADLVNSLGEIEGEFSFAGTIYAKVAIPANFLATALYINATPGILAGPRVAQSDIELIQTASSASDLDALESAAFVVGTMRTDLGLILAKNFEMGEGRLSVGATPKLQRIDTFAYSESISTFDDDEYDASEFSNDDTVFNIDLGVVYTHGNWSAGVVGRNLISQNVQSAPFFNANPAAPFGAGTIPIDYEFKPEFTAGIGYRTRMFTLALDADLVATNYLHMTRQSQELLFGEELKNQFLRGGVEVNLFRTLQLRAGFRHDLEGTFDDAITAGLGFSPFGRLHVNLTGIYTSDRNLGAGAQLAFTF
ncbi:MAG: conjugal transfer protein TraF [Idiomarina sp.]|nr:conjugal transfer protein TraF [Idiomarina sp.]